jgi:type II secretory pathway pseudopilin PulG
VLPREAGLTLLETIVALGVIAAVTLGIAGGMRAASLAGNDSRDARIAFNALRAEIERTKAQAVYEVIAEFSGGTEITFAVPDLNSPTSGALPGSKRLLSEREAAAALNVPELDLNFNGVYGESAVDGSYRILVFEVRVDWRSPARVESLQMLASVADDVG